MMNGLSNKLALVVGALSLAAAACTVQVTEVQGDPAEGGGGTGATGGSGGDTGGTGGIGGTGGSGGFTPIEPEQGVAQDITLSVYSDGWGTLLGTMQIDSEGPVVVDFEEEHPYYDPPVYYVYAEAAGFYTELYSCSKGASIDVDLDAVPERPNAIAGVIFAMQGYFADRYLENTTVRLLGPEVDITVTTDGQGRYGLDNLPAGSYTINFDYQDEPIVLDTSNDTASTDYADLSFYEPMQAS